MEYLKRIILLLVMAQIAFAATTTQKNDDEEYDPYGDEEAYISDDDYTYDEDEITEPGEEPYILGEKEGEELPFFEVMHLFETGYVGQDVILPCPAENIKDKNVIMWYNNTQILSQQHTIISQRSRLSVYQNFSLHIADLKEYDTNLYYCQILPQNVTLTIRLRVLKSELSITSVGKDVTGKELTVNEGDPVEFSCTVPEKGDVTIKWSKWGERVEDGVNGVHVAGGKITIGNTSHHNHGLYQCIGDRGERKPPHGFLTLNVRFSPKITIKRHFVNAALGDESELYCEYHAYPGATTFWAKEGTELRNGRKYSIQNNEKMELYGVNHTVLYVKNVEASDFGEYECIARNSLGEGSGRIHLIQEPEAPQFEHVSITGQRAKLQWLVRSRQLLSEAILSYKMNATKSWMTEQIPTPQFHNSSFWKLQHDVELTPGTWHVQIKAKNFGGWSRFSKEHTFVIENSPNTEIEETDKKLDDAVLAAGVGGSSGNNSANGQYCISTLLNIICPLLVIFTLVS